MGTAGTASARAHSLRFGGWPGRPLDRRENAMRLLAPPVLGLAIVVVVLAVERYTPENTLFITLAFGVSAILPAWLFTTKRTGLGLALLLVYLGCLDGYLKLTVQSNATLALRDVLLYSLALGVVVRKLHSRESFRLPPLGALVVGWVLIVLVNVLNPNTASIEQGLISAARQHLEFVPLFFLAFVAMRSTVALRGFLVILCVVGAVNGAVSVVQSRLTPEQLSTWGPGYEKKIRGGEGGLAPRTYQDAGGTTRVRPFGLGGDAGSGGALCGLAVAALLALAQLRRNRFTWIALAVAAPLILAGVITSQSRTTLLGSVIAVLACLLVFWSKRNVGRAVAAAAAVGVALYVVVGAVGGSEGGDFSRYNSIRPDRAVATSYSYRIESLLDVGRYAEKYPLGAGLGTAGPTAGATKEGAERAAEVLANAEGQANFIVVETGVPGLIVFLTLLALLLWRGARLRRIADPELALLLSGCVGALFFIAANGWSGPITAGLPGAAMFWFLAGLIAYWTQVVDDPRLDAEAVAG
jgi:hypothetical protein